MEFNKSRLPTIEKAIELSKDLIENPKFSRRDSDRKETYTPHSLYVPAVEGLDITEKSDEIIPKIFEQINSYKSTHSRENAKIPCSAGSIAYFSTMPSLGSVRPKAHVLALAGFEMNIDRATKRLLGNLEDSDLTEVIQTMFGESVIRYQNDAFPERTHRDLPYDRFIVSDLSFEIDNDKKTIRAESPYIVLMKGI